MAQVKVWNDNAHEYRETFKDREIVIPPKSCIEMEYYDAHEFRGVYRPVKRDADNQPIPQSFKMIRVEEPATAVDVKVELNKCVACKFQGDSPKALIQHVLERHADQAAVDEEAEKELAIKKKRAS